MAKTKVREAPTGWKARLEDMNVDDTIIMPNGGNTVLNGRSAIKDFCRKHPKIRFQTKTDRRSSTFKITRIE